MIPAKINKHRLYAVIQALNKFLKASDYIVQMQTQSDYEKFLAKSFERIFKKQGELIADKIKNGVGESAIDEALESTNRQATDTLMAVWKGLIAFALEKFPRRFVEAEQKKLEGIPDSFQMDNPGAISRLRKVAGNKITQINETTRKRISQIIVNGRENGDSYDTTAKAITDEFEQMAVGKPQLGIASRAHLIAITETAEAYGFANYEAATEIGEVLEMQMEKYWQTMNDDRVSEGCRENQDADWIDAEDEFPSGSQHEPRFPGCRCTVLYRVQGAAY